MGSSFGSMVAGGVGQNTVVVFRVFGHNTIFQRLNSDFIRWQDLSSRNFHRAMAQPHLTLS
jgi:hypothetical protein